MSLNAPFVSFQHNCNVRARVISLHECFIWVLSNIRSVASQKVKSEAMYVLTCFHCFSSEWLLPQHYIVWTMPWSHWSYNISFQQWVSEFCKRENNISFQAIANVNSTFHFNKKNPNFDRVQFIIAIEISKMNAIWA